MAHSHRLNASIISKHKTWMLILRSDLVLSFPLLYGVFDVSDQRVYQPPRFPHLLPGSFIHWAQVPFNTYKWVMLTCQDVCFFHAFVFKYLNQVYKSFQLEIWYVVYSLSGVFYKLANYTGATSHKHSYLWLSPSERIWVSTACLCIIVRNELFLFLSKKY